MKRRSVWTFFANPFVVLADIMVSLVFILTLFLLTTMVYNEQMALIALRDSRRQAVSQSLIKEWHNELLGAHRVDISKEKYQYVRGRQTLLEVEDDGSLQRFRFPVALGFRRGVSQLEDRTRAEATLTAFGRVILQNRAVIKSLVIEGHADPLEVNDSSLCWPLSEARAETIRRSLQDLGILRDIDERRPMQLTQFLKRILKSRGLSYASQFNEWHAQEYQAHHTGANHSLGVFPAAWVISSGRGDQVRRAPVVEFKLEYTERNTITLDEYVAQANFDNQAQRTAAECQQKDSATLRSNVE